MGRGNTASSIVMMITDLKITGRSDGCLLRRNRRPSMRAIFIDVGNKTVTEDRRQGGTEEDICRTLRGSELVESHQRRRQGLGRLEDEDAPYSGPVLLIRSEQTFTATASDSLIAALSKKVRAACASPRARSMLSLTRTECSSPAAPGSSASPRSRSLCVYLYMIDHGFGTVYLQRRSSGDHRRTGGGERCAMLEVGTTAIHEAGHAAVVYALGFGVEEVVVRENGSGVYRPFMRGVSDMTADVLVDFAGRWRSAWLSTDRIRHGSDGDFARIAAIIEDGRARWPRGDHARVAADGTCARPPAIWDGVLALAEALERPARSTRSRREWRWRPAATCAPAASSPACSDGARVSIPTAKTRCGRRARPSSMRKPKRRSRGYLAGGAERSRGAVAARRRAEERAAVGPFRLPCRKRIARCGRGPSRAVLGSCVWMPPSMQEVC